MLREASKSNTKETPTPGDIDFSLPKVIEKPHIQTIIATAKHKGECVFESLVKLMGTPVLPFLEDSSPSVITKDQTPAVSHGHTTSTTEQVNRYVWGESDRSMYLHLAPNAAFRSEESRGSSDLRS